VYQEGRRQTDVWLPNKPAYLRIYLDIPGQFKRVKHNEPLGKFTTREQARRTADKWILTRGVNNEEQLAEAVQPTETTFRAQAVWWLSELASGRLKSRHKSKRGGESEQPRWTPIGPQSSISTRK
jgi:hypothetical protein